MDNENSINSVSKQNFDSKFFQIWGKFQNNFNDKLWIKNAQLPNRTTATKRLDIQKI